MRQCMGSVEGLMRGLSLAGKSAVELSKQTPNTSELDLYYLQITQYTGTIDTRVSDGTLAVLCSTQNIRIFDAARMIRTATLQDGEAQVTKVIFGHESPNIVYSASVDSKIRCWDLRKDHQSPASIFTAKDNKKAAYLSLDVTCNDRFLCSGTQIHKEDALLFFWDRRQSDSVGCYEDLHCDDITQVKFHPSRQDLLLTASDDGLVNELDISKSSEEDALQQTLDTQSTPDKVSWMNDKEAFVSTYCNTAYLWNADTGDELIKHRIADLQDGAGGVDISGFVDCYQTESSELHLLTSNDKGEGHIFVFSQELPLGNSLCGGHTSLIRACTYNKESRCLYTVGEDAIVCCWKPAIEVSSEEVEKSVKPTKHKAKTQRKPYQR